MEQKNQIVSPEPKFCTAAVFSDHMVLQRGKPLRIFGKGLEHTQVYVLLKRSDAASAASQADVREGKWLVTLPPQSACDGCTLIVTCLDQNGTILAETTFTDVSIGEVWLAGGQSNMEFELQNCTGGTDSLKSDKNIPVRFYQTPRNAYKTAAFYSEEGASRWQVFDREDSRTWSAVGYYFARKLSAALDGVTVGIIGCNLGGTSASAWINREELLEDPELSCYVTEFDAECADLSVSEQERAYDEYLTFHTQWDRQCAALYRENPAIEWAQVQEILGPCRYPGPKSCKSPFRPGGLYDCMLRRVTPYTLAGILFYQGESDDHKPALYRRLLTKLIESWRRDFEEDTLPFLFVQLPMHRYRQDPDFGNWPVIRQAQQQVHQTLAHTGMAVIIDKGEFDNIHPLDKAPVADRLALQALAHVYGRVPLEAAYGPMVRQATKLGNHIRIDFDYASQGLVAAGDSILGFEVAGEDGVFSPVPARIDGSTILLKTPNGSKVRYLWANYAPVTLFGANGLPAAPFQVDICL